MILIFLKIFFYAYYLNLKNDFTNFYNYIILLHYYYTLPKFKNR